MKRMIFSLFALGFIVSARYSGKVPKPGQIQSDFRPPAYPLITSDPYFSIWAFQGTLYNGPTRHWTGTPQSLWGVIRVDSKAMAFLRQPIPQYETILPLAGKEGCWKYTISNPGDHWQQPDFDDYRWQSAKGAFSDRSTGSGKWIGHDIWARQIFELNDTSFNNLLLNVQYDDGITIFLDGVKIFEEKGGIGSPKKAEIRNDARNALHRGKNIPAIHCVNMGWLAYLDGGLVNKKVPATHLATPKLPENLKAFSRSADFVTFKVHANDGQSLN